VAARLQPRDAVDHGCTEWWICSTPTGKELSCKAGPALPEQLLLFLAKVWLLFRTWQPDRLPGFCYR